MKAFCRENFKVSAADDLVSLALLAEHRGLKLPWCAGGYLPNIPRGLLARRGDRGRDDPARVLPIHSSRHGGRTMSSIRPLITITILVAVGVFLFTKINEGPVPLPAEMDDALERAPATDIPPLATAATPPTGPTTIPSWSDQPR